MVLSDEEQQRELDRFIKFLEGHKVTELEDLAARFGLSTKVGFLEQSPGARACS